MLRLRRGRSRVFSRGAQKGPAIVCRHECRTETLGRIMHAMWTRSGVRVEGFGKQSSFAIYFALPQMNRRNNILKLGQKNKPLPGAPSADSVSCGLPPRCACWRTLLSQWSLCLPSHKHKKKPQLVAYSTTNFCRCAPVVYHCLSSSELWWLSSPLLRMIQGFCWQRSDTHALSNCNVCIHLHGQIDTWCMSALRDRHAFWK